MAQEQEATLRAPLWLAFAGFLTGGVGVKGLFGWFQIPKEKDGNAQSDASTHRHTAPQHATLWVFGVT